MDKLKKQIDYAKFIENSIVTLDIDYAERLLLELTKQYESPTLEEVKKEWEELGYEIIEDNNIRLKLKKGLSTIQISKIKKVYKKVIGCEEDNRGNFLTLQEHNLLTKTFKALGWGGYNG